MALAGGMKVGFLNATSLKKHIWQFQDTLVNDSSFQIFGIAETRLDPDVDDGHVGIQG